VPELSSHPALSAHHPDSQPSAAQQMNERIVETVGRAFCSREVPEVVNDKHVDGVQVSVRERGKTGEESDIPIDPTDMGLCLDGSSTSIFLET
jgi:hypothetical protein